ncbi:MAG TPA: NADH-quinone oxidoreductase subunit NuoH [Gemmatimonadales bacterium]|nr:NADH-quinone oxidoreductase subunit NuoH [Gemmatimonadales bacterium]
MSPELKGLILLSLIKLIVVFTITLIGVALLTLMERKVSAWMQYRRGPNRVGFAGLLQPAADGVKNILKEETLPGTANRGLFVLAPTLAFIPALTLGSIIPWASPLPVSVDDFGDALGRIWLIGGALRAAFHALFGQVSYHGLLSMAVADLPIGMLFVLAVGSTGVYGIALAGWSSNSKYSLLGGLRASAQMVSYEVAMALAVVPVLMLTGDVSFGSIIKAQQNGWWFIFPLFLAFHNFLVSGFAETNRLPFDLPEAESELIAGYHTEYSAMKFSMFFIAEYANMVTVSAMVVTLFLGGWDIPFIHWDETPGVWQTVATGGVMFLKTFFWLFFFMWVRWTLPRFRYDQLMALGWKVLMPIGLAYVMLIAIVIYLTENVFAVSSGVVKMALLLLVNVVLSWIVFMVLDRGLLITGTRQRAALPTTSRAA